MGRHSAPADEDEDAAVAAQPSALAAAEPAPSGRHAGHDAGHDAGHELAALPGRDLEPVRAGEAVSVPPATGEPHSADGASGRREKKPRDGSAADLALLRADPTLLARCLAAALVPFLLYVVVLLVVGSPGRDWLIWIWIPAIVAGVVAGAFLDRAHTPSRTTARDVPADQPANDEP